MSEYIQIGMTALRNPDGSFQPEIPLYVKRTEQTAAAEQKLIEDGARMFAARMRREAQEARKCKG